MGPPRSLPEHLEVPATDVERCRAVSERPLQFELPSQPIRSYSSVSDSIIPSSTRR